VSRIGFVCPVYNAVQLHYYTSTALTSFFQTTPDGVAIVVDDATPDWTEDYENLLRRTVLGYSGCELEIIRFPENGGLTRSWNTGLARALDLNLDYAIAGNNDIIFTPEWYLGLCDALQRGYALVGPLSNAPGITAGKRQQISRHYPEYRPNDSPAHLAKVSRHIQRHNKNKIVAHKINGFFQMATCATWDAGRYSPEHIYRPSNPKMSNGSVNPTPLMTGNEDELQARWAKLKLKSAIALSSYIFHYRSVTRGEQYKKLGGY
jgi:glycosyltransferase involved in cell wall biosynthesis